MASWKLTLLLVAALVLVFAFEVDGRRGGGRRRNRNRDNTAVTDEAAGPDAGIDGAGEGIEPQRRRGRRPGRGRGRGGRGGRRGGRGRGAGGRGAGGRRRGRRPGVNGNAERLLLDYAVSNGEFGLDLYKNMSSQSVDNFVISPLSVHSALSMLLLGAGGQTKRELIRGLRIRSPIHPAFQSYNQSLDHGSNENATLMMANALFKKRGIQFKRRFVNKMRTFYNSATSEFAETNPEEPINAWISEKTMEMIPDFLSQGEITDNMMMMLINAIYFKGMWKDKFDEEHTTLSTFTDIDSNTHDVYMMRRSGDYNMFHSNELRASAIRLPYKGGRYSLNLILPDDDTNLADVEGRMTHQILNETLSMLLGDRGTKVLLEMPKFSMDTEQSMETMLRSMGIRNVFESNANFQRMTRNNNVVVNKVKHRCIMEVDEEGTEAAAVTGISVVFSAMEIPFRANRPFTFVLRDDLRAVNLFMGRYVRPQGDNVDE